MNLTNLAVAKYTVRFKGGRTMASTKGCCLPCAFGESSGVNDREGSDAFGYIIYNIPMFVGFRIGFLIVRSKL